MQSICYKIIQPAFFLLYSLSGISQTYTAESFVLDTAQTGTKEYIARDGITLSQGFSFTPAAGSTFRATIDQTLVFPPAGNTYLKPDGTVTADSMQGAVVGAISGMFDVSPTGAATYSVPIEIPQGIQGMQPSVSLVYNSQSGNGIAGMCWNIGGLSMISRTSKNYYFDNDKSGIIWDNSSPLALDGQRLIKINTWGNDSIEYRTESGLDKIIGYSIQSWGPQYFKIYTREGQILRYGNSASNASYCAISASPFRNLGWFLYRVEDVNSNYVEYTYVNNNYNSSYRDNRISEIKYGNGNAKVASVHFQYKNKSSSWAQYIGGLETKNQLILDKIEVKGINNETQLTYQLSYEAVDNNEHLKEISLSNDSGISFNPLKFDWSNDMDFTHQFSTLETMTFEHPVSKSYYQHVNINGFSVERFEKIYGDLNGDGLTDVVARVTYKKGSTLASYWIAYMKLPNSNEYKFIHEQNWYPDYQISFLLLDKDQDGKDELFIDSFYNLGNCFYTFTYYRFSNDAIMPYPLSTTIGITSTIYNNRADSYLLPGDFTGNGSYDFILCSKNNKLYGINIGGSNSFGVTDLNIGGDAYSRIYLTDINGNGKPEIMYINSNVAIGGVPILNSTVFYEYNAGTNTFDTIYYIPSAFYSSSIFRYNDEIYTGDFNGDGNTDFLVRRNGSEDHAVYISTGNSIIPTDWGDVLPKTSGERTSDNKKYRAGKQLLDIDGDGKTDIIIGEYHSFWPIGSFHDSVKVYISTGDGFQLKQSTGLLAVANFMGLTTACKFNSLTGKGLVVRDMPKEASVKYLVLNKNIRFNKVMDITNSFGKNLTIEYDNLNTPRALAANLFDNNDMDILNPDIRNHLLPDFEVVKSVDDGLNKKGWFFHDPRIHWQGKGFMGFLTIQDTLNSIINSSENLLNTTYHFIYPYKNSRKIISGNTVTTFSEQTARYSVTSPGSKRFTLKQDSIISSDYLTGTRVKKSFANYDSYLNPQTIVTDYGNGITSTESLAYIAKGSWAPNRIGLAIVTQSASGVNSIVRSQYFTYDNKGQLLRQVTDSTHTNKVATDYSNYDVYGNPGTITTTANGVSRSKTMTYSSYRRYLKTEKDNQINHTITYNYNESKGLLISKVDRLGTVSYQYDSFGRLKLTTYPDGIKAANALQWAVGIAGKPANAKFYSYSETSGQSPVWVWYDDRGREIRKDAFGLNAKKTMVDTEYYTTGLHKGRVHRVSEPYFENAAKTWAATYTYDRYGRDSIAIAPMGTTTYAYSGKTVTVASPTDTLSKTVNDAGWTVEETTNGKTVNFTHYASGLIKTATPQGGQAIAMEYDLQGNRTKLTDPDAGVITSQYDGWGQLLQTKQKIHAGQDSITTAYNYLPSGLLQYKLRNGEQTNYGYDNLYRLNRIYIAGKNGQNFVYDSRDRITQVSDTVDGTKVFVRKTEYDLFGRVSKETYPGGYYTTNQYDKYSYLTGVTDPNGSNIWQALESNARGQLTKTQSGTKQTLYGFDTRGFPTSIVTSGIVNMSYNFNLKGNLDYRQDNLTGYKESFTYDAMNRLTNCNIYQNNSLLQSNSLAYVDSTGNIQSKSDLDNYTMNYGANGKPHALTSISGIPTIMNNSNSQEISYTDFRKVKQITEGSDTLNITYGTDEQRIKTVQGRLTRYYMGNYEEEIKNGTVRKIHYLYGGNGLAAVYVQNGGNDTLYYVHTDFQGSLTALSLPNGTVAERYAFDPWGNRRNPANWTQRDARTAFILNRGYTMHEHLTAFNLINMNGRVYDPLTSMFLSPDPYLQSPGDWLNYNRYAYALNNPFRYIDPDGELFFIIPSISYSKSGGWDFGLTFGVGIPKLCSLQATVSYNTGANGSGDSWTFTGSASFAGFSAYGGYNTNAGWIAGANFGLGPLGSPFGVDISSNITNFGVNYSQRGGWSFNAAGFNYNGRSGWSFDPSIGASYTLRSGRVTYDIFEDPALNYDDPIPYDQYAAYEFMKENGLTDINAQWRNLFADGTLPDKNYSIDAEGNVIKKGDKVLGTTMSRYKFFGKTKSDIYLYNTAFQNPEKLFLVIGHELIHVNLNYVGLDDRNTSEATAYQWNANQLKAWGLQNGGALKAVKDFGRIYHSSFLRPTMSNRPINPFR